MESKHKPAGGEPTELDAKYANYFEVGQNAFEVVVDFGQFYEGDDKPRQHTRIVMTRYYARALAELLTRAVEEGGAGVAQDEGADG